jgi:hypothetical protein
VLLEFPEFLIVLLPESFTVAVEEELPESFTDPPVPPRAVLVLVVLELSVTLPPFATGALTFVLVLRLVFKFWLRLSFVITTWLVNEVVTGGTVLSGQSLSA